MIAGFRRDQRERLISAFRALSQSPAAAIRTDTLAAHTGVRPGAIRTLLQREISASRIHASPVKLPGQRPQHDYRPGRHAHPTLIRSQP